MDATTTFLLAAICIEPVLVLWVAPMLTQHRVKKDAVSIIDGDMMPRIEAKLRDVVVHLIAQTDNKLKELGTFLTEDVGPSNAGSELGKKSGEARQMFAAQEEAVLQAIQQAGPEAILKIEALRMASPQQYKIFIRSAASDPAAAIAKFGGTATAAKAVYL